jgi:hypothetical protein
VLHELLLNNHEKEIVTLVSEQGKWLDICGSYYRLNIEFYAQPPIRLSKNIAFIISSNDMGFNNFK